MRISFVIDLHMMTQRDQPGRFLGTHDTCDLGNAQYIALANGIVPNLLERFPSEGHFAHSNGCAQRIGFARNVDHVDASFGADVCKISHEALLS
jgi:hypothetical protein